MLRLAICASILSILAGAPAALAQAVHDGTHVPGRATMTPGEAGVLAQLNVWMDKFDHDPKAMCEDIYTADTQVWAPNAGFWYKNRDTWTRYEIASHARRTTQRATKFNTAFVRGDVAVVESNGWAATLYFEPATLRVFADRTYIPSLGATGGTTPGLTSMGSLPPAVPDKTSLRYGAVEERDSMRLGHQRTRATGLKIIAEPDLTPEEQSNVAAIRRRAALYNSDPARMVDEAYAVAGFQRVMVRQGRPTIKDRAKFRALQAALAKAFPGTKAQLVTLVARGDTVAYETVTSFTPTHEEWSLTVARLKDGRIVEERVYESTAFDPASPVGQAFKAATS